VPGQIARVRALVAFATMTMLLIVPAAQARMNRAERSVIARINLMRAERGERPVRGDARLARAADAHNQDMLRRDFFAHESSNGQSTYTRVRRYRHRNLIGETLAYVEGRSRAGQIVRMWRHSPGHYAVLTDARLRRIGVSKMRGTLWGHRVTMWTADLSSAH
jgi:uncharacterized protein YkwD